MVFGLFKRKDPICGMKEKKGIGLIEKNLWFCSNACLDAYKKRLKKSNQQYKG